MEDLPPSERKFAIPTADGKGIQVPSRPLTDSGDGAELGIGFTCYVPGRALSDFRPLHAGVLVPAGYDVSWTIHYTSNGTELTDRPEVGLTIANEPPQRLLVESAGGTQLLHHPHIHSIVPAGGLAPDHSRWIVQSGSRPDRLQGQHDLGRNGDLSITISLPIPTPSRYVRPPPLPDGSPLT